MNTISQQLVKHQSSNAPTIVLGEFNSKWGQDGHRGDKAFHNWTVSAGLVNGAYDVFTALKLPLVARSSGDGGTWIDHLLHTDVYNNIFCVGAFTVQGSLWITISDYSLIWGHYVLPTVHDSTNTPLVTLAPREFVEIPLNGKDLGQRFAEDMDSWLLTAPAWEDGFEAGQFLHRLSIMSKSVTKRIAKGLQTSLRSS